MSFPASEMPHAALSLHGWVRANQARQRLQGKLEPVGVRVPVLGGKPAEAWAGWSRQNNEKRWKTANCPDVPFGILFS
jgi:hypothetical protein